MRGQKLFVRDIFLHHNGEYAIIESFSDIFSGFPLPEKIPKRKDGSIMYHTAFYPADLLLPDPQHITAAEMQKWACVACDQYTSQPEYWQAVERLVGQAPSTLRLTLPEIYLGEPDVQQRIDAIAAHMKDYLSRNLFLCYPHCFLYLERTLSSGSVRRGLIGMVDLEDYDYLPSSHSLIRATEGTVLERIPPRVKIRQDACLELPHVMMLIDDAQRTVIEPLAQAASQELLTKVYDFPLMMDSGAVKGYLVDSDRQQQITQALQHLAAPEHFAARYALPPDTPPLLFAVGDGNHSLATAKACYERLKQTLPRDQWENHPARYALVEVVNLHDDSLQFEPVHRFVTGVEVEGLLQALRAQCEASELPKPGAQQITAVVAGKSIPLYLCRTSGNLPVGTLQNFLDHYQKEHGGEIDYIHGDDVAVKLSMQPHSISFLLPAMEKDQLFPTVLLDGVLPRKTFSMGHACDKRFYLEARKITR